MKRNHDPDLYEKRMSAEFSTMFKKHGKIKREPGLCVFAETGNYVVMVGHKVEQITCNNELKLKQKQGQFKEHCERVGLEYKPSGNRYCSSITRENCDFKRTLNLVKER